MLVKKSIFRAFSVLFVIASLLALNFNDFGVTAVYAAAYLVDLPGPPGSAKFGSSVTALPNGNFVVTDPSYNSNKGAAFLYSPNRVLISQLTSDFFMGMVGSGGVTVLTNGNYLVRSPGWGTSTTFALGAVTWCSQVTGCSGIVSAANSLVGSHANDQVGRDMWGGVTVLTNGNYLVRSPDWDNGSVQNAGAVTWGDGTVGTKGVVSAANSLVGSTANDAVGSDFNGGVTVLSNGNYLVRDSSWDNGSVVDAGAITWGNGAGGTKGAVSAANSLVGGSANDAVGGSIPTRVIELTDGNYVVSNLAWNLDAGAVTWGSGATGVKGPISAANSLVGANAGAPVGLSSSSTHGVTALTNGNYLVSSPYWSVDGSASHFGAVTWGSGASGVAGTISAANSLVGNSSGDYVGSETIALTNGNYVVNSPYANAVTWGNGTSGATGVVSASNSLVGLPNASAGGGGVIALANGNYVVSSPSWYDQTLTTINIGAVTWGNGTTGITGPISTANSLVGVKTYDSVGDGGLVALTNGNYVVVSTGTWSGLPGVTWVNGGGMATGTISAANSLVGNSADDQVGGGLWSSGVIALSNGNYVVGSPFWDNGGIADAGAVTWGDGTSGTTGVVSAANSLVGGSANDQVGSTHFDGKVIPLANGNYVVSVPQRDNGGLADAGAVAWGNGAGGTTGVVSTVNSLVGSAANDKVGSGSFFGAAGVTPLTGGNYLVNSPHWSGAAATGAVTWGDGTGGTAGAVSVANSLVNTSANDTTFCDSTLTLLPDGNASIHFPEWNNGSRDGAFSLIAGDGNAVGPVGAANSVLGVTAGSSMVSDYDAVHAQLIVGRPWDNKVTILRLHPFPTPTPTRPPKVATFQSAGAYDGWALESGENSNAGGSMNSAAATFNLGDNAAKKQYRGILSFNTGSLPDNAIITSVMLKVRQQAILGGGNPVSIFGGFMVDVKNGFFGTASALQIGDFQAAASQSYGPSARAPVGGWYSFNLINAKAYINKLTINSGLTQIRLRFKLDDNNNAVANILSLYSGNPSTASGQAAPAGSQPQLVITYILP